jgi:hypothetical protein
MSDEWSCSVIGTMRLLGEECEENFGDRRSGPIPKVGRFQGRALENMTDRGVYLWAVHR